VRQRQTAQNRAANVAANRQAAGEIAVPVAEAGRLLGIDTRTVRRMCVEGSLQSFVTPGGHRRVPLASIETIREGNANLKRSLADHSPLQASPVLRQKKEHIEELNLTLQERKAKMALKELEDEERRLAEQEDAEREEQERLARRMRLDAESEQTRRNREREQSQAEARAAQSRQEWEAQWLRDILSNLPRNIPPELKLEVTEAIRRKLPELYVTSAGHAEDLVEVALDGVVETTLRPFRRRLAAEKAVGEALSQLPLFARGPFGQLSDWERHANEQAVDAIDALPETATFEQMAAVARMVGKQIAQEYEHDEKRTSFMIGVRRVLPGQLSLSSPETRADAEEAVEAALEALPVGAGSSQFDRARDAALAPFIATEAHARAEREAEHQAQQAKAKLEAEADRHLDHVFFYLVKLEADPDGWVDFEGQLYECAKQIKQEIKPDLIEELPLDFSTGQHRVEQLVDQWLADHLEGAVVE
jgi:hypothetical protein